MRNRQVQRALKRHDKAQEQRMNAYTDGHADYTPYSAITGKEKMSRPTLTNMSQRVGGSFNG